LEKQLARKGLSHRAKNHYQHRVVLIENSDKNSLLQEEDASAKRKLMSVGGCTDTPLDLVTTGNVDGKRPCLGNGQTVMMRTPTQNEFVECWSETIIRNGLPPALVDDPLFRKALVTTSHMGQTTVSWVRELLLERGTRLCHITIHSPGKLLGRG
jgi:hypothetical protein